MRVAFIGKGGSGKTTIATLFIYYIIEKEKNKKIIAIDADLNDHFGQYLGFINKPPYISEKYDLIKNYIFKDYPYKYLPPIGTIPPRNECNFFLVKEDDFFLKNFSFKKDNLFYINTGIYQSSEIGNACFHGKLNSLELYLNYLLDRENDLIVIDSMAGVDFLATSLYAIADVYFFVVEPDFLSVNVFNQYIKTLGEKIKDFNIKIFLVLNKIYEKENIDFILEKINDENFKNKEEIVVFNFDFLFRNFEQNNLDLIEKIINNHQQSLEKIRNIYKKHQKRDLDQYLKNWLKIFKNECQVWVNDFYKTDFSYLIDQNFSLKKIYKKFFG